VPLAKASPTVGQARPATDVNFVRDVVAAADPRRTALIELTREGDRREWTFGDVLDRSARLAGTMRRLGLERGDVVMTLIGNRSEWVFAMVACFRIGAVVLPCSDQLRASDLALRIAETRPRLVIADERNRVELEAALAGTTGTSVLVFPDDDLFAAPPELAYAGLELTDPCLVTFTSGTAGEPKPVYHGQRYLFGQLLQATRWLGAGADDIVWCTAASGWSKSARNAFIAPWLRGATALIHDARFDPDERLEIIARERVSVLCMAPTEYRAIAKRTTLRSFPALRGLVAAGEALNPEILALWREATSLEIRDGYGQTETGQLTANPPDRPARPASMGLALPGIKLWVEDGELVADPATIPTFFLGYADQRAPLSEPWRTGDRVRVDDDGYLFFESRVDDVIISSGYRIGPFEVESVLIEHAAVADAAVVAYPDEVRGSVVRAFVVLRDGAVPSDELVATLQEHVKRTTAPYKYPRIVDFVPALPKTASGKIRRAALRESASPRGS
jgi:acyl-coenzyme A synthetase/AMP-(fatty) acid ligase